MESFNALANVRSWLKGKLSSEKAADGRPRFYRWPAVTLILLLYSSFGKSNPASSICQSAAFWGLRLPHGVTVPAACQDPSPEQSATPPLPVKPRIMAECVRGWRPAIFSTRYLTLFIVDIPAFVVFYPPRIEGLCAG